MKIKIIKESIRVTKEEVGNSHEDASTAAFDKQHEANELVWDSVRSLAESYRSLEKSDETGLMSKVVDEYMQHFRTGGPTEAGELQEKFVVAVAYAWSLINSK